MGACDGVPLGAGVPGFDSETGSPFASPFNVGAAATSLGKVADVPGESLTGDSSLTEDGSTICRSLLGVTRTVVRWLGFPLADFRLSLSLLGVAVTFDEAGIVKGLGASSVVWVKVMTAMMDGVGLGVDGRAAGRQGFVVAIPGVVGWWRGRFAL